MPIPEINESGFFKEDSMKQDERIEIPLVLPVLPLPDVVTYPYTIIPLLVSTERGINAVDQALSQSRMVLLLTQRDQSGENPTSQDMYDVGTVGAVIRMLKLPD
jgi:ATP-dependent Lon protease